VVILHGGGSSATQWMPFCGMNETADRHGFIAVYPNGTGKKIESYEIYGWNGGPRRPGGDKPEQLQVDDVGFIRAVIDDLATVVSVDPKRVYACGMSMGGIMVYRLASELSDRIASAASIAGPMGMETCNPRRPVPLLHIHGTEDPAVPFGGGKGPLDPSGTDYHSVQFSIDAWVEANGCDGEPVVERLPDTEDDGTSAVRKTHGNGRNGSEVVLIEIQGGGHTWPGREFGPELKKIVGPSSKDVSANELIWAFFEKHPMK